MRSKRMKCNRCGKCCSELHLPYSPTELRSAYNDWINGKDDSWKPNDIHLLYPMLRLVKKTGDYGYTYRCVHVSFDKNEKATCGIYKIRPEMCKGFPYYHKPKSIQMNQKSPFITSRLPEECAFRREQKEDE